MKNLIFQNENTERTNYLENDDENFMKIFLGKRNNRKRKAKKQR